MKTCTIDNNLCTHCAGCSSVCPVMAITIDDTSATVSESCIACMRCKKFCPISAIESIDKDQKS